MQKLHHTIMQNIYVFSPHLKPHFNHCISCSKVFAPHRVMSTSSSLQLRDSIWYRFYALPYNHFSSQTPKSVNTLHKIGKSKIAQQTFLSFCHIYTIALVKGTGTLIKNKICITLVFAAICFFSSNTSTKIL